MHSGSARPIPHRQDPAPHHGGPERHGAFSHSPTSHNHAAGTQAHPHASGGHPHTHAPHTHDHHHHDKPHKHGKARKSNPMVLPSVLILLILVGVGIFVLSGQSGSEMPPTQAFVDQLVGATQGKIPQKNVYGGALKVASQEGGLLVTATDIPPKICVSAGWELVRKGTVSVNGETPNRISAAILSELCNREKTATISWSPKTDTPKLETH